MSEIDVAARKKILDYNFKGVTMLKMCFGCKGSMINGKGAPPAGVQETKELMGRRAHGRREDIKVIRMVHHT